MRASQTGREARRGWLTIKHVVGHGTAEDVSQRRKGENTNLSCAPVLILVGAESLATRCGTVSLLRFRSPIVQRHRTETFRSGNGTWLSDCETGGGRQG